MTFVVLSLNLNYCREYPKLFAQEDITIIDREIASDIILSLVLNEFKWWPLHDFQPCL